MDSFELNKIIGAILLVALIVIGLGKFTDSLFNVEKPEQSAYKIEGFEAAISSSSKKEEKTMEQVDIAMLLATGDLTHGEKVFKKM